MISFPTRDLAENVAKDLVSTKLAACVQLMNGMTSFYMWEGKPEESTEVLMVAKVSTYCGYFL